MVNKTVSKRWVHSRDGNICISSFVTHAHFPSLRLRRVGDGRARGMLWLTMRQCRRNVVVKTNNPSSFQGKCVEETVSEIFVIFESKCEVRDGMIHI